eukprot:31048-Pelagococcus_subviridis.AAC.3
MNSFHSVATRFFASMVVVLVACMAVVREGGSGEARAAETRARGTQCASDFVVAFSGRARFFGVRSNLRIAPYGSRLRRDP